MSLADLTVTVTILVERVCDCQSDWQRSDIHKRTAELNGGMVRSVRQKMDGNMWKGTRR